MASKAEIGTLIVVVLKARNLNDKHFYKQDVYAQASLSGNKQKTPTDVKGGQHPVWDAELRYQILKDASEKNRQLEISCYSVERRKDDDLLGKGTVDITETLKTGEFDDWVPLSIDGVQRGDVYIEMTFYSNGPAPPPAPAPTPQLVVPSRPLQVPQNGGLVRRPSKLPEHERLARLTTVSPPPPSNMRPGGGHGRYPSPNGYGNGNGYNAPRLDIPSGHSSRSSSSASSGRAESPLPPIPGEFPHERLPGNLLPAGGRGARPGGNAPHHIQAAASPPKFPPSTLRPGGPAAAATQGSQANNPYVRRQDASPSRNDYRPPPVHQQSLENNPYVGRPATASPAPPGAYYEQAPSPQTAVPSNYGGGYERVASPATAVPPSAYPPPNMTPAPAPGPQYNAGFNPSASPPPANYPPQNIAPAPGPQYNAGYNPSTSPAPANYPPPPTMTPAPGPQYNTGYNPSASPVPPAQPSWSGGNDTPSTPVFFPVPSVSPAPPGPSYGPPPPAHYSPPQQQSPYPPRGNDGLPDPYLQARYQTPLPLPPGASSPPRGRQPRPEPEGPPPPPKATPAAPPPTKATPASPPMQPRISEAEQIRLEALKIEEEEETRRREQEQRDLELAMQLDREFNQN